jgi:hypothetical protein
MAAVLIRISVQSSASKSAGTSYLSLGCIWFWGAPSCSWSETFFHQEVVLLPKAVAVVAFGAHR